MSEIKEQWEVVTLPPYPADRALAIRRKGTEGYIEVKTASNFADLNRDAKRIAAALNTGFTHEDVDVLRDLSEEYGAAGLGGNLRRAVASLADRISALLPPEEP